MSIRVTNTHITKTFAPRDYPCHICGAQPGHNCTLPNGSKREWSHNGRGPNNPLEEESK